MVYRLTCMLLVVVSLPEEAEGQLAWLGSEELHRGVGGALTSALDRIMASLVVIVAVTLFVLLYGLTRLIEWRFTMRSGRPRPVISTGLALVLFSFSFWVFAVATGLPGIGGLLIGVAVGFLPAILVLLVEVVRVRRRAKRHEVRVGEVETPPQPPALRT